MLVKGAPGLGLMAYVLTHLGWIKHICVGNLTTIGSGNGLSPDWHQAIMWANAGILLIGPLRTNFSEFITGILTFSLKKVRLKVSSAKWRPCCLGLNVLSILINHTFYLKQILRRSHKITLLALWVPNCCVCSWNLYLSSLYLLMTKQLLLLGHQQSQHWLQIKHSAWRWLYAKRDVAPFLPYWSHMSQIPKFMGLTWGPPGSCRPQMGPMLAPWTLLSGVFFIKPLMFALAIDPLRPSDTYMPHQTSPPLVQIMACCLFGAKPLSEPIRTYCQLDPWEHIWVMFQLKYNNFHWRKCIWTCYLPNGIILSRCYCVDGFQYVFTDQW